MTQRLWISEPTRRTCIATVTSVRGEWFEVDRALFAPSSRVCRHPQPADKGTVWVDGEKRRLAGIQTRPTLQYRLRGTVPSVGARLQCELDQTWRSAMARGHTAMHLLIAASDVAMTADPEVRGNGHARLTFAEPIAPARLEAWLAQARAWVAADLPISARFATGEENRRFATPQWFSPPDPVPGDVAALVEIPGVCAYPCDGTYVDRTGRLGGLRLVHAQIGKGGFVVVVQAQD